MSDIEKMMGEVSLISKSLQLELAKGNLKWEDEEIQFFIPVALSFTDFDWLELIAENNLVKEDEIIVKNFLAMVKSLKNVNEGRLNENIAEKIGGLFK